MSDNITLEDALKLAVETGKLYVGVEAYRMIENGAHPSIDKNSLRGITVIKSDYLEPYALTSCRI